jgi:ketosteroid isomerase-like protein
MSPGDLGNTTAGDPIMTKSGKLALLLVTLLAFGSTAALAAGQTPQAMFKARTDQWMAQYNSGKAEAADKIVAMYATDGMMMPPDVPAAVGRDGMHDYLVKDIAASKAAGISLSIGNDTAGTSGNLGWHAGTFAVHDKDGKTLGTGKFVEVWKKINGQWLIIRDIWNNDAPAPSAPAATQ